MNYSVISVKINSLPGHTKNQEWTRFCLITMQFLYPWAEFFGIKIDVGTRNDEILKVTALIFKFVGHFWGQQ